MLNNIFGVVSKDYDFVEEKKDGVLIIKKVLYKKDGTEVVFSRKEVKIVDEVAKIDTQIASLEAQKVELVQTAKDMNIALEEKVI